MSAPNDLVDFILARVGEWEEEANGQTIPHPDDQCFECGGNMFGLVLESAELLSICKAYRTIARLHRRGWEGSTYASSEPGDANHCEAGCDERIPDTSWIVYHPGRGRWPCHTLRTIASTWSDHEDYRAEWAS